MNEHIIHSTKTPKGIIQIEQKEGWDYPGYYILINGLAIAMIEYDDTEERHAVRVWNHDDLDNDAEYTQFVPDSFSPPQPIVKKAHVITSERTSFYMPTLEQAKEHIYQLLQDGNRDIQHFLADVEINPKDEDEFTVIRELETYIE